MFYVKLIFYFSPSPALGASSDTYSDVINIGLSQRARGMYVIFNIRVPHRRKY
jgi:hypothetical protein